MITTSSSLLLLLLLVLSFPSSSRIGRKRGSKFCCTIRTRSSPSSSESRISITSTMIFSFLSGDDLVFVLARKNDAKNNERERRRSLSSRTLAALSLSFCARKSRDGSSFPSTSSFVCCVRRKTVDFEYEGKVPYWTLKCVEYSIRSLFTLSFL